MRTVVNAGAVAIGPYSDAAWAGELLMLSGRVGLLDGGLADGVGGQTGAAIANAAAVLATAGLGLDDVVRCTVYLADMADFSEMNAVYAEAFGAPPPARTTIAVSGLPMNAKVEIEMTARASS